MALDLEAIESDVDYEQMSACVPALIAEVRKLREIVLKDHYKIPMEIWPDICFLDRQDWPCPSVQAAGAT